MKGKIPIAPDGSMYSFDPSGERAMAFTWEDHKEWEGQLNFSSIGYRGHSHFKDVVDREWVIFSSDADGVLKRMERGVVFGKWMTVKRGQSYGIMPVEK